MLTIFKLPAQEDLIRGGIEELQPELSEVGYVEKVGDMIPGTKYSRLVGQVVLPLERFTPYTLAFRDVLIFAPVHTKLQTLWLSVKAPKVTAGRGPLV